MPMELIFHVICLVITLFVLQSYVSSGFHAREHRLLPLVLGLIALNNFYRITFYITGDVDTFRILTDLLTIQMLYLLIHYVEDFMKFQLSTKSEVVLFSSLVLFDFLMIFRAAEKATYQDAFRMALIFYVIILLSLATYVRFKNEVSAWEGHVNNMLYFCMALPGVALLFRVLTPKAEEVLIPFAFEVSCLIVYYLLMTGQLSSVTNMMQENFYNFSEIPAFIFDSKMRFRDANSRAHEMFAQTVEELECNPKAYSFYGDMLKWSREPEEEYVQEKDGSFFQCQLHPIRHGKTKQGYILVLLDVTQQKKETVLMEQLKKEAETQSVLKSRFLASVSHDLRSPLHAIIGGTDILKRQKLPKESMTILSYIHNAGNALLEQVDTILSYSKLEAGMLSLKKKEYSFYELLQEQARLCLLNLQKKDVIFTIQMKDPFPERVKGDALRVAQVFQNLLSNACKYTENGSITLSLNCEQKGEKVYFRGSVTDTGVGMNQTRIGSIFKEYVSYSEEMGVEGTGLGLSMVKQLIEMMGGEVTAESSSGKGTSIKFSFYQEAAESPVLSPMVIGQEILQEKISPEIEEMEPNWIYPEASVLVVDDMEVNRVIFQKLAAPWAFIVDTAASGEEAVERIKKRTYQLVVLDQMMPGMSGLETADKIREYSDVPLVLMTADITDQIRTEASRHGIVDFMTKPIGMQHMQEVIESRMPLSFRKKPEQNDQKDRMVQTKEQADAYVRTLESYCREVGELFYSLPEYARNDLKIFQTKVHGIKGISRQIGREPVAREAEIMEMAAKTDNRTFIEQNLRDFLGQLQEVTEEVRKESVDLKKRYHAVSKEAGKKHWGEEERRACWEALKLAFSSYDVNAIEKQIQELADHELTEEEQKRLPIVREACENLDYEIGRDACIF